MKNAIPIFTLLSCMGMMSLADVPKRSSGKLLTLDMAISHYANQKLGEGEAPDEWLFETNDDVRYYADLHYEAYQLFEGNIIGAIEATQSLVHKVNALGDTPLHLLARNYPRAYLEHCEPSILGICRVLVKAGVDLSKKNIYGLTALETAQLHKGFDSNMSSVVVDYL